MTSSNLVEIVLTDVCETYEPELGVVCIGRDPETGERVTVTVKNVPHEIYVALCPEQADVAFVERVRSDLNNFLNAREYFNDWTVLSCEDDVVRAVPRGYVKNPDRRVSKALEWLETTTSAGCSAQWKIERDVVVSDVSVERFRELVSGFDIAAFAEGNDVVVPKADTGFVRLANAMGLRAVARERRVVEFRGVRDERTLLDALHGNTCRRTSCERCPVDPKPQFMNNAPCRRVRFEKGNNVVGAEIVSMNGFMAYEAHPRPFAKFLLRSAHMAQQAVWFLRREDYPLERGSSYDKKGPFGAGLAKSKRGVFGATPDPVESFMSLKNVSGFQRVRFPRGRDVVSFYELRVLPVRTESSQLVRWLCYDIETISADDPKGYCFAEKDAVGMISVQTSTGKMMVLAWPDGRDDVSVLPESGAEFHVFPDERTMLQAFDQAVRREDPDIVTGFNTNGFDLPYLLTRAKILGISSFLSSPCVPGRPMRRISKNVTTNQQGTLSSSEVDCPGQTHADMYPWARSKLSLKTYGLSSVAKYCSLPTKLHMPYEHIWGKFWGTREDRAELAEYCMHDTVLASSVMLSPKIQFLPAIIGGSQVNRVRARDFLNRGVQHMGYKLILSKCSDRFVFPQPTRSSDGTPEMPAAYMDVEGCREMYTSNGYEGALVLDPVEGFHEEFVVILDFAGLYPSIIRAMNLCLTTMTERCTPFVAKWPMDPTEPEFQTPTGNWFVNAETRPSVCASVLTDLTAWRKKEKKEMLEHDSKSQEYAAKDGLQKSIKISSNSVYGATGNDTSRISCKPMAESVTKIGRMCLSKVVDLVNNLEALNKWGKDIFREGPDVFFVPLNRRQAPNPDLERLIAFGVRVVYGDTDSVFVGLRKCSSLEEAKWAINALDRLIAENLDFPPPMKMEPEGIMPSSLFVCKKRYMGPIYLAEDGYTERDFKVKGVEMVRRDFFPFLTELMETVVKHHIFAERKNAAAWREDVVAFVRREVSRLLKGKVPVADLVKTANVSKPIDQYQTPVPAHIVVAKQLRDSGVVVEPGKRVEYVFVRGGAGKKKSECVLAFDLMNESTSLDYVAYVDMIAKPLSRILRYVLGDEATARCFDVVTYETNGGMERFLVLGTRTFTASVGKKKRRCDNKRGGCDATTLDEWLG